MARSRSPRSRATVVDNSRWSKLRSIPSVPSVSFPAYTPNYSVTFGATGSGGRRVRAGTNVPAARGGAPRVLHTRPTAPRRPHLSSHTESLQHAADHQRRRAPPPHLRVRRQKAHRDRGHGHGEEAEHQRALAAVGVADVSGDDAPDRTRDEGAAEDEVAIEEVGVVLSSACVGAGRKEGFGDGVAGIRSVSVREYGASRRAGPD